MKIKKYMPVHILTILTAVYAMAENHVFTEKRTWPSTPAELVCDGIGCILISLAVITYVLCHKD